jgi:hypothetical protein
VVILFNLFYYIFPLPLLPLLSFYPLSLVDRFWLIHTRYIGRPRRDEDIFINDETDSIIVVNSDILSASEGESDSVIVVNLDIFLNNESDDIINVDSNIFSDNDNNDTDDEISPNRLVSIYRVSGNSNTARKYRDGLMSRHLPIRWSQPRVRR